MRHMSRIRATLLAAAICVAAMLTAPMPASAAHHKPQWLRALELRSDGLNRKYHLGRYAHIQPPPSHRGFDWAAAAVGSGTTIAAFASLGVVVVMRGRGRRSIVQAS